MKREARKGRKRSGLALDHSTPYCVQNVKIKIQARARAGGGGCAPRGAHLPSDGADCRCSPRTPAAFRGLDFLGPVPPCPVVPCSFMLSAVHA
jgi:hypothetical protein